MINKLLNNKVDASVVFEFIVSLFKENCSLNEEEVNVFYEEFCIKLNGQKLLEQIGINSRKDLYSYLKETYNPNIYKLTSSKLPLAELNKRIDFIFNLTEVSFESDWKTYLDDSDIAEDSLSGIKKGLDALRDDAITELTITPFNINSVENNNFKITVQSNKYSEDYTFIVEEI